MYRKKLFLESVHKLGMPKLKEDAVISLFEATLDPENDETHADIQDVPESPDEPNTEGSAFTGDDDASPDNANIQEIKRIVDRLDTMLEPFRRASVSMNTIPSTPNGTRLMVELGYRLDNIKMGGVYHAMRQAMQMMSWEVIQFNKASREEEICRLDPRYAIVARNPSAKKFNAITMIRKYMETIDRNLDEIKEAI